MSFRVTLLLQKIFLRNASKVEKLFSKKICLLLKAPNEGIFMSAAEMQQNTVMKVLLSDTIDTRRNTEDERRCKARKVAKMEDES